MKFQCLVVLLLCQVAFSQHFPNKDWERDAYVTFSGWDTNKLEALRTYVVDSTATTAMLLIHDGQVVFEYGNLSENSYIASCRKSILSMLYGTYVEDGTIDLEKTLVELEVDRFEPLLEIEKTATINDIIASRSGIYLPASNPGDLQHLAPDRGSVSPGELWLYNNWDFNMAGYIFEKETGTNIYDELERQLAVPLQMQDWDRILQQRDGERTRSDIMAYHMWFSGRDMARIGLLMLNNGNWKGTQLISKDWVKEMTTPKTSFKELDKTAPGFKDNGAWYSYGYMWWLWEKPDNAMLEGAYTASGAWGQNITVYPKMNTVLVIRTNDAYQRQYGDHNYIIEEVTKSYSLKNKMALNKLHTFLEEGNIEGFLKNFKAFKKVYTEADSETVLNELGYHFLAEKEYENALMVLKYNVEQYIDHWNLYDSLGEAYFLKGDYTNALIYYKKAMVLNTENQYGYNKIHQHIINRIQSKLK